MSSLTSLTIILSIASAGIGVIALGLQSLTFARQSRTATEEIRKLAQEEELRVLRSDDIQQLGRYLYDNIGSTRLTSYVTNKEVRDRVSRALDGILTYLGPKDTEVTPEESEEIAQEAQEPEFAQTLEESQPEEIRSDSEMQRALEEITFGETWNGLARMRRYIESTIRALAGDLPPGRPSTVGRLLSALRQTGYISDGTEKQLRYAINVANSGIHGGEISVGQAQEAWEAAVRGLATLPSEIPRD